MIGKKQDLLANRWDRMENKQHASVERTMTSRESFQHQRGAEKSSGTSIEGW